MLDRMLEGHIANEFELVFRRRWHRLALGLIRIEYEGGSILELLYLLRVKVHSCFADATSGNSVTYLWI